MSGFLYPHQRSRDACGSPHPLAVPGRPRPRRGPARILAGGTSAGTSFRPGVSPDGGDSNKCQVPDKAGNKDAGLRRAAGEAVGKRNPEGEGTERGRRHRGADLVPQVGKASGGWQGKLTPMGTAAAAGKINKWERAESWAESEGER